MQIFNEIHPKFNQIQFFIDSNWNELDKNGIFAFILNQFSVHLAIFVNLKGFTIYVTDIYLDRKRERVRKIERETKIMI